MPQPWSSVGNSRLSSRLCSHLTYTCKATTVMASSICCQALQRTTEAVTAERSCQELGAHIERQVNIICHNLKSIPIDLPCASSPLDFAGWLAREWFLTRTRLVVSQWASPWRTTMGGYRAYYHSSQRRQGQILLAGCRGLGKCGGSYKPWLLSVLMCEQHHGQKTLTV